jgi:hypothetical protein
MSQDEKLTFKKNQNGSWRLFLDDKDLDVSFFIPDGCKIEDYNIDVVPGSDVYKNIYPYKDVVFRLLKEPSEMGKESIIIKESGGLTFEKGLVIDIKDELFIGHNENTLINFEAPIKTSNFICAGNKNSTFTIPSFGSDKLIADKIKFSDNVNTKINFIWKPENINIFGNVVTGTTDYKSIVLGGNFVNFDRNEINMKNINSKLILDSKKVESIECVYEVSGTLSINLEPSQEEKDKDYKIFLRRGRIIAEDSVLSKLQCRGKDLEAEGTLRVNGKSFLTADGTIWLTGNNNIETSKIFASNSPLKLVNAFIRSANLSLDKPLDEETTYNIIEKARVECCDIDHINGILSGAIERVYGEKLSLGKNSSLETTKLFSRNDDKQERDYLEVNNLSLKENSFLKVCLPVSQGEKPKGVTMENTIVRGNSEIYSDGNLELTNCELNETKIKQKDQQIDTKCSNTSFKNEVTLSRVESVNRSVLNNSHISSASNESIKVDGENLKDVSNYEEYLNEKYAQTTFVDVSSKSSLEAL